MVKYGQKSTFDRKVVQTQFFYQNDQNEVLKIFPLIWIHFALKCFLKWLIGQLEILWRINQDFAMLTPSCVITNIWEVLHWALIKNENYLLHSNPEEPFLVVAHIMYNMPKYRPSCDTGDHTTLRPYTILPLIDHTWLLKSGPWLSSPEHWNRGSWQNTMATRICASLGSRMKFKTLCYPVFGSHKNTALPSFWFPIILIAFNASIVCPINK